jgi:transcriptional regulator of heat shock response
MLSERKGEILNRTVLEYIGTAQPVSSQYLEERYGFGISPATIRNDMKWLEQQGFLTQPHVSAGRMPTDKGYRFFVDSVFEEEDVQEQLSITNITLRDLAAATHNLIMWNSANTFWKEGWELLLEEPEFEERENRKLFANFVKDVEGWQNRVRTSSMRIFIGEENPFSKVRDFSIIISGEISIVGPKRMAYDKNISLMKSLWKKGK